MRLLIVERKAGTRPTLFPFNNQIISNQNSAILPSLRLLLRHAVHRAQAPDEVSRINRDDFSGWEKMSQGIERNAIVRAIEYRSQHDSIGDVEISVAGGKASALEDDRLRHGKFDDSELFAVLIAGRLQSAQVRSQRS